MSEFLSAVRIPAPVSARTLKYVETLTREGDNFDYYKWLERVREEEAQATQVPTAIPPRDVVAPRIDNPIKTRDGQQPRSSPPSLLMPKALPRTARRHQEPQRKTPKARLRRWLEKVHCAWGEFQSDRRRDSVYAYLEAVFAIVEHYRVRRRINRLLRHAFKFANLPFDKNADTFGAVIRCTSGRKADGKIVSKYARALRYASRHKEPDARLKTFMKKAGGVNGCAARYAQRNGQQVL